MYIDKVSNSKTVLCKYGLYVTLHTSVCERTGRLTGMTAVRQAGA